MRAVVRSRSRWAVPAAGLLLIAAAVAAQELTFEAKVDKTRVKVGDPVALTLTFVGELTGTEFPTPQFPEGWTVAATSQATNLSFQGRQVQRATSLTYVLLPGAEGTFKLGPFEIKRQDKTISTEPIQITVEKSALPPRLGPEGGRFTL